MPKNTSTKTKRVTPAKASESFVISAPRRSGRLAVISIGSQRAAPKAVSAAAVRTAAVRVSGSPEVGERWFNTRSGLLGGRTPREAAEQGDGDAALGILLNVAGS